MFIFPEYPGAPVGLNAWIGQMRSYCAQIEGELSALSAKVQTLQAQNQALQVAVQSLQIPKVTAAVEADISTNTTLTTADLNQTLLLNCTSSCTLTLPTPTNGSWLVIHNRGTGTISVSDGVNTVATLVQNRRCELRSLVNSSAVHAWPTSVPSTGLDGYEVRKNQLVIDNATAGLALKDSAGHFWTLVFNTNGALVSTDQGTTYADSPSGTLS